MHRTEHLLATAWSHQTPPMQSDEQREVYATIDLALRVGEVLLSSGAGTADATATMLGVTAAGGLRGCEVDITFTSMAISYQAAPAFAVGLGGYSLGRRSGVPPLVVVVAGSIPLLPGLTIYKGLYELMGLGNLIGIVSLTTAVAIGVALASGVILGDYVAQLIRREARRLEDRLAGPRLVGPRRPVRRRTSRRI